jgi:hypothetical protein
MNKGHGLIYKDEELTNFVDSGFPKDASKILFLRDLKKAHEKINEAWTHSGPVYDGGMVLSDYYRNDRGVLSKIVLQRGVPIQIEFLAKTVEKLEKTVTKLGLPFDEQKIIRW